MIEFEPLSAFAPETFVVTLILIIAAVALVVFVSFLVALLVFAMGPHWVDNKLGNLKIAGRQLVVGHAVMAVLMVLVIGGVFFGAFKMHEGFLAAQGATAAVEEYYDADLQVNDSNNTSSGSVFSGTLAKDTGAPVIVTGRVEGNTISVYADENASSVPLTVESFEDIVGGNDKE